MLPYMRGFAGNIMQTKITIAVECTAAPVRRRRQRESASHGSTKSQAASTCRGALGGPSAAAAAVSTSLTAWRQEVRSCTTARCRSASLASACARSSRCLSRSPDKLSELPGRAHDHLSAFLVLWQDAHLHATPWCAQHFFLN